MGFLKQAESAVDPTTEIPAMFQNFATAEPAHSPGPQSKGSVVESDTPIPTDKGLGLARALVDEVAASEKTRERRKKGAVKWLGGLAVLGLLIPFITHWMAKPTTVIREPHSNPVNPPVLVSTVGGGISAPKPKQEAPVGKPVVVRPLAPENRPITSPVIALRKIIATNQPPSVSTIQTQNTNKTVVVVVAPPRVTPRVETQEEKEARIIAGLRTYLANNLEDTLRSGRWGELYKRLGPWGGKLEQIEPDPRKRDMIQAWTALWNEADQSPNLELRLQSENKQWQAVAAMAGIQVPAVKLAGSADNQADAYCAALVERKSILAKGMDDFIAGQERQLASLGGRVGAQATNLAAFLGDGVATTNAAIINDGIRKIKKHCGEIQQWAKSARNGAVPLSFERLPEHAVKELDPTSDVAWSKLYELIQPMDERIAALNGRAEGELGNALGDLAPCYSHVMSSRDSCVTVRVWRNQDSGPLIHEFLDKFEIVHRLLKASRMSAN